MKHSLLKSYVFEEQNFICAKHKFSQYQKYINWMFLCRHVNRMLFVICKKFYVDPWIVAPLNSIRFRLLFKFCRYGFLYDGKISIFLLCNIVKRKTRLCFLWCTIYFVQLDFLTYNSRIEFTQVSNFNKPSREITFSKTRCLIVSRIHCTSWI